MRCSTTTRQPRTRTRTVQQRGDEQQQQRDDPRLPLRRGYEQQRVRLRGDRARSADQDAICWVPDSLLEPHRLRRLSDGGDSSAQIGTTTAAREIGEQTTLLLHRLAVILLLSFVPLEKIVFRASVLVHLEQRVVEPAGWSKQNIPREPFPADPRHTAASGRRY